MRTLRSLARDERGASLVEMALVMPVFASLLIGMVDLGRGYSAKLQLQQAAQRAIEKVMQTSASQTVIDSLKAEGASAAGVPITAVAVTYWLECNGAKQSSYDTVCADGATYARYLEVEITKTFEPMFKTKYTGSNADGTYTLKGKAGIRTQ
jgi:Flp pilus assembly protein TadG